MYVRRVSRQNKPPTIDSLKRQRFQRFEIGGPSLLPCVYLSAIQSFGVYVFACQYEDFKQCLQRGAANELTRGSRSSPSSYAPTQKLGLQFGELPSGVMEQWLRWTGHEEYCFSEPELKSVGQAWPGNVLGISFDDDEIARPSAFPGFSDMLKSAHVTNLHLKPSDVGVEGKIGHVGFFRSQAKEALWKPMLDFIMDKRVPASLLRKTALPVQTSRL